VRSRGGQRTFSEAFAAALAEAMEKDPRVVVVTPARLEGSALVELKLRYPDRVHDVGIAEQLAVTFCAGLAAAGARPVCAIYSTFLQRAFDQVVHDVCLPGLPVVFAVDRAGLVGADGATHQGTYDVTSLRALPGLTILAPVVGEDLPPMLASALAAPGPTVIRFPRGTLPPLPPELPRGEAAGLGARWLLRAEKPRLTLVTLGPVALAALEAARAEAGWSVLDARCVSPLDASALLEAAESGHVVVVEEGSTRGGLGSAVLELYAAHGRSPRVRLVGMPDVFVPHGDARAQRAEMGLDAEGLRRAGQMLLGEGQ
jgi:1-deoxy-D-xylulose-5-phosphate synthase